MCGIIAVLAKPSNRPVPTADEILPGLVRAHDALAAVDLAAALTAGAVEVEAVDGLLRGGPGVTALLNHELHARVAAACADIEQRITTIERRVDTGDLGLAGEALEAVNAAMLRLKDAVWAVRCDRIRTADGVRSILGDASGTSAIDAYLAIQIALSALDRLEVRGRDSAGLHILVSGAPLADRDLAGRDDPLFTSGSVRAREGSLGFVYKAAAEIGELGDNTAALRAAIASDSLLRDAVSAEGATVTVLGHTRWASVGIISEPNAHPLNSEESDGRGVTPYVVAALNGDVDNHAELRAEENLTVAAEITTDAKVIPALVSRRLAAGDDAVEAFRATVSRFDGSVAIGAATAADPGQLLLALRGSGQGLYVGLARDAFIVASEAYGIVEETDRYVALDGENGGEIVVLDRGGAGSLSGMRRLHYDGSALPVAGDDVATAGVTTRDIDRRGAPHFLIKEIAEAPRSFAKTLVGRITDDAGRNRVELPEESLPAWIRARLASGEIAKVVAIGQGTAAVAAQAVAAFVERATATSGLRVDAELATELSGFGLVDDMRDTLVVAISQSGTTTDTNRTIDLVRARGAAVIAVVNRRNSDITERADGVIYTSDGRDVEMAVPSTKAFYAQVAAGVLLAEAIADAAGCLDTAAADELIAGLRALPAALTTVLDQRDRIAEAAQRHAPPRRYWAMVGNGLNRIAAAELRIKLSELCYKSIACDSTEDKKHIDLSSEPLILVCAAGLEGATADDVAKEIAIYRAHKAAPIVIATAGETRFGAALEVIEVPAVHPDLDFVLAAMAGHLFGYEAALAIDAQARMFREIRAVVDEAIEHAADRDALLDSLRAPLEPGADRFLVALRSGVLNGHLEASTAVSVASLLRYATGVFPLDAYEIEYGKVAAPESVVDDLLGALSAAIDELTRPIDAIKHQAKTVTVGISRAEDTFVDAVLVHELLATGAKRDLVGYRGLRTLAALSPAVVEVTGFSRYAVTGDVSSDATIHRIDAGGIARDLQTRTDVDPVLKGTKRRAATEREVTVGRGARDGRTFVLVPETQGNEVVALTLLHVHFAEALPAEDARAVLSGYRGRYSALTDAVCETEPVFDDQVLAQVPLVDLLVEPVHVLAANWR